MSSQKRWAGGLLTVLWVIQFVLVPLHIGSTAGTVMEYAHDLGSIPTIWIVTLSFFSICFLTLPLEITAYLYNFLHPWLFVGLQIFKSLFYTIGAVIDISNLVQSSQLSAQIWTVLRYVVLGLNLVLLITFWFALVYGAIVLHRHRRIGRRYSQVDIEEKAPPRRRWRNEVLEI